MGIELKRTWHKKDKCWYFFAYIAGKNKYVPKANSGSEAEALAWLEEYAAKQPAKASVEASPKVHTIRTVFPLVEAYWKGEREIKGGGKAIKPKTARDWAACIRNHVLTHTIADVPMANGVFTIGVLVEWLKWLKGKKTSRGGKMASFTVRNTYLALKMLVRDARRNSWVDLSPNPVADESVAADVPVGASKCGEAKHLTAQQVIQLITSESVEIPVLRKVQYVLAFCIGARDGELWALRWSDLQLEERTDFEVVGGKLKEFRVLPTVAIRKQIEICPGEVVEFSEPKKGSDRIVPLHPLAVAALKWWRGRVKHGANDPVFPNRDGEFYRAPNNADLLRRDLVAAGLPSRFVNSKGEQHNFVKHTTRSTFYTLLKSAGVAKEHVDALLGHKLKGNELAYTGKDVEKLRPAVGELPFGEVVLGWMK